MRLGTQRRALDTHSVLTGVVLVLCDVTCVAAGCHDAEIDVEWTSLTALHTGNQTNKA